jgi:hypothetical protein
MMSAFNATSHRAFAFGDDGIDPIIASGGRKRPQEISNSIGDDPAGNRNSDHPSTSGQRPHHHRQGGGDCDRQARIIRQQPPANADADAHHRNSAANGGSGKRRRRSGDELQYAGPTARGEAVLAGRPGDEDDGVAESLPSPRQPDGVDVAGGCGVATAREFDERFGGGIAGWRDRGDDYDLSSMHAIAGLLRATRRHYGFSSSDDEAAAAGSGKDAAGPRSSRGNGNGEGLPPTERQQPKSASGRDGSYAIIGTNDATNYDEKLSMDNSSHTLSSWTPSSGSSNRLNYCGGGSCRGGSNIDNNNRSEGQSSDMAGGEGGGSSSSLSSSPSLCSDSSENGNDADESPQRTKADDKDNRGSFDGPYKVVG